MKLITLLRLLPVPATALLACDQGTTPDTPGSRLEIAVAPLEAGSSACYLVEVFGGGALGAPAYAPTVWSETLCSDGSPGSFGINGELRYVGACDSGEGTKLNTVRLTLTDLTVGSTTLLSGGTEQGGFINPCPQSAGDNGCVIVASCEQAGDTQVSYDLTIVRQAPYGFFDIAVRFDQIACSAKVDCVDDNNQTLGFLQKPDGSDGSTVIVGLACFGGTTEAGPNPLNIYLNDLTITCADGGSSTVSLASDQPGLLASGDIAQTPGTNGNILYGAALYVGGIDNGGIYANVALGMNRYGPSCVLTTRSTASNGDGFGVTFPYATPTGASYPYVDVAVTLGVEGTARTCTRHPIGGANGVATAFTGVSDTETFDHWWKNY